MNTVNIEELKYPIGKLVTPPVIDQTLIRQLISEVEQLPTKMKAAVHDLTDHQLDTPYRPDGWTLRQVVHHCADSHMNALIRLKLALTEDNPTIKPYAEALWAELPDAQLPISHSLKILEGVHVRWTTLMKTMQPEQWDRSYTHPQYQKVFSMKDFLVLYAWHGNHHLAHITQLKKRMNW